MREASWRACPGSPGPILNGDAREISVRNLRSAGLKLLICAISLVGWNALGLGGDYPNGQPVNQPSWPTGMSQLVNITNRVGGLFVNAEDLFFFSGPVRDFNAFLASYANLGTIEKHRLILHDGAGEAYSLGGGNKRPCDWSLDGCPASWRDLHHGILNPTPNTNYVLETHFWTGGKIPLDQVVFPKNIEFAGDYFKHFESITNGMTRSEVEKTLTLDGGLQVVSLVRFLDPHCPGFKITVEFAYSKSAADQNRAIAGQDDKVIKVSNPYRERPFMD